MTAIRKAIARYPIWSFLILNYLISWSFLFPSYQMILENDGITPLSLIGLIGAYGPSIAAIAIQWIIDPSKVKILLKKLLMFRTTFSIVIFVLIFPLAFYIFSYSISQFAFKEPISLNLSQAIYSIPLWFLLALPFGPMGEELGWRGFMLPRLLDEFNYLKSSILLGLAWGVWHLASFSFPGAAIPEYLPISAWTIGLYCLNTIGLSIYFTWIHVKTGGSVFYAILLHAFFNASSNVTMDLFGDSQVIHTQLTAYCLNFIIAGMIGLFLLNQYKPNNPKVNN